MTRKTHIGKIVLMFLTLAPAALGQAISCVDALGTPVAVINAPRLSDIGQASVYGGRPVIFFNEALAQRLPPNVVTFFLYHECGHQALGHVLGAGFALTNEQAADCWAARTLVSQGQFDEDDIRTVQAAIAQFGRADWTHLPGPMRAMNLQACLGSADSRSSGRRRAGDSSDLAGQRAARDVGDNDDFVSALQSIVRGAPNAFRSVRGRRDPDDNDDDTPSYDANRNLPGATGTCDVFGGRSPSYVCTMFRGRDEDDADTAYDHYIDEARTVARGWRWSDITRRSVEKGRRAVAPNGTSIRIEMTERSSYYVVKVWVDGPE
jgi:hypothetical protein